MILTRNSDIKLDRNRDHLKYYTMLFIAFLQGYFKQNDQGQFRWSDDLEQTEIVICDQDADLTDKYLPRIVTVRGPSSPLPMWFGDEGEPYNNATGAKKRTILIQSSITFHCIAVTGLEAQQLAYRVYRAIHEYYMTLQRFGIHKVIRSMQISPETPANAVFSPEVISEGRLIMVTVPFIYRNTIVSTPSNFAAARELSLHMQISMTTPGTKNEAAIKEEVPIIASHPGVPFNQPNVNLGLQDPEFRNDRKL